MPPPTQLALSDQSGQTATGRTPSEGLRHVLYTSRTCVYAAVHSLPALLILESDHDPHALCEKSRFFGNKQEARFVYDDAGNMVSAEPVRRRKLGATTTDRLGSSRLFSPRALRATSDAKFDFASLERAYLDASNTKDETVTCVRPHILDAN